MSHNPVVKPCNEAVPETHNLPNDLVFKTQALYEDSEAQISKRLRSLRRKQGVSIRGLAARCGLSANTLSLIENRRTSPSVHTLQALARGLDVPLTALFQDEPESTLVYQKQGQRALLRFAHGTLEKLGEGLPPLGSEPILVTLAPGCVEDKEISHSGREFIYCLEGKATCIIGGQEYHLAPGDSLLFNASAPHRWHNASPGSTRLLVLFCPMEAIDQSAERHLG